MSTTIIAMFDSRNDAETAKERLKAARVESDHVHIHDKSSAGYKDGGYSSHEDRGIWNSIENAFLPDEDRYLYEEGLRRGGVLLIADVDDDCVEDAVRVLEDASSIDVDDRSRLWRSSGWDYSTPATGGGAAIATGVAALKPVNHGEGSEREEVIPIVKEQLVVGKRDVSRGGARVRSYVTEVPVHEQVRLRNEQVQVERRAVDQPLSDAEGDAFRERTIDVTVTGQEVVVSKSARLIEEVVVLKTVEERGEVAEETVRVTLSEINRRNAFREVANFEKFQQSGSEYIAPRVTRAYIEHSLAITRVVASASDVFGSHEEAMSFLTRPAIALEQRRPIDLLSTAEGIKIVEDHLERVRYGVYS